MAKRITRVYTRTGDDGTTGLGDGKRVDKDSLRIEVIGGIDELNSMLGVLTAANTANDIAGYLLNIQHRLFDVGAEISLPGQALTQPAHVIRLEELIDTYNAELQPLEEFILPGGSMPASLCHLARSVCRRLERELVRFGRTEYLNPHTLSYINRLGDLLFVFARTLNRQKGGKEIYWSKERLQNSA